jgi:PPP family 3-phenylpropionic acid transporter
MSLSQRNLWLMRAYYFLWIGAGGFLMPFVTLVYQARGLSGTEIGLLSTWGAIAGMVAAPVWGRWGDRVRAPRRLLQLALLGSACFALLRGVQTLFWGFVVFVVLDALVNSGSGSLSSMQALAVVEGEKAGFGSIRLWGSLGWAAAAPLAGWLMERHGLFVPFAGYAVMLFLSIGLLALVRGTERLPAASRSNDHMPTLQVLRALKRSRPMTGLALALIVIWLGNAGRQQFESIYLAQLGAPTGLIGWANTAGALVEPPFMLLADRILRRYGAGRVLRFALFLQALAYLPVALFPSVISIFVLRVLFSVAFSLNAVSYLNYLVENAPDGQGATVISLFEVTLRGGIGLLAAPLAGLFFDQFGAHGLYWIGMAGSLLAWFILGLTARRQ